MTIHRITLAATSQEGREAEIMIALMNKFIDLTESDQKPAVFTAVNTTPGVIFVESFFEGPVRTMVVGIQDLYGWRPGSIKLVETQDMPACVTVPETAPIPQKGTWVRIKGGIYKGDCAKVGSLARTHSLPPRASAYVSNNPALTSVVTLRRCGCSRAGGRCCGRRRGTDG